MVACSVYLYVAILGANVRICREPVVDSWECRPDDLANAGIADPGHELVLRDPSRPRLRCMCQCTCKQLTGPAAQEHHSQDGRTRPFSSVSLALPGTPPGNAARPRPPPQRGPAAGPDGISMRLHRSRSGPDRWRRPQEALARRRARRRRLTAMGGHPPATSQARHSRLHPDSFFRSHTSTAAPLSSSGAALREAITGGWMPCAPPRLTWNFLAGWPARRRVTRSGVMTVSPSIGNADRAPVRDLMTPRRPAIPPRRRPAADSLGAAPGGGGCPGSFTGPGHPGWGIRPRCGRMTCMA